MKKKKIYRQTAKHLIASEPDVPYHSSEPLSFEKVWRMFQETDRKFQESERLLTEKSQETDRKFQETDRKIKELAYLFTGQWGKLVEALMAPGCLKLFRERGIDVVRCHPNVTVEKNRNRIMEIDLLLINAGEIVVEEIKTTAVRNDIDDHLKRLSKFRHYFPEYRAWKVYGAIGALVYFENSDDYARENGFFVLKATGEGLVEMDNPPDFRPALF